MPRPWGPKTPVACASSTRTCAPCRRARAHNSASGASTPSMLKTPSVTISAPSEVATGRQATFQAHECVMIVNMHGRAAQPATIDQAGVIEAVRTDASSLPTSEVIVPTLAAKPVGNRIAASCPSNWASALPIARARETAHDESCLPNRCRTPRSHAEPLHHVGMLREAEIIVRGEVAQLAVHRLRTTRPASRKTVRRRRSSPCSASHTNSSVIQGKRPCDRACGTFTRHRTHRGGPARLRACPPYGAGIFLPACRLRSAKSCDCSAVRPRSR